MSGNIGIGEDIVISGLTATSAFECGYCSEKLEVETIIIDGCYCRLEEDTNYCPVCGRKLRDI